MSERIDEGLFDKLADRTLAQLELALNDVDGLEADLESGILTIEFSDGSRFVVNSHRAARQIWMAASARAWHFDVSPEAGRWTASKTDEELWACIKGQIEQKLGRRIQLGTA
jgi:CyaY protein